MAENWQSMIEKMEKEMAELKNRMGQKNEENIRLKEQNAKLDEKNRTLYNEITKLKRKLSIHNGKLPGELLNEVFATLPMENAFGILDKMPNGLLARNVRKMLNSIKMAMKNNKWNADDCGLKLCISKDGMFVRHLAREGWNFVRGKLPILIINLNRQKPPIAYFELEILKITPNCCAILIGFCTHQFPFGDNGTGKRWLGGLENSIGIYWKYGIDFDGSTNYFENLEYSDKFFNVGDVIGFGIVHSTANLPLKCFATCNGKLLGMVNLPAKFTALKLFPVVALKYNGDLVRANFGQNEWLFNPKQLHK